MTVADVAINSDLADIPSVNFAEQGTDVVTPSAGRWQLYFKSGGLYAKDDAGNVIGPFEAGVGVATDAIWDTAGDIAQATGANAAAKLPIGTGLQILRANSGATALEYAGGLSVHREIEVTDAGGAADMDFDPLPTVGRHLLVELMLRGAKAAAYDNVLAQVNGLSTSIYDIESVSAYQSTLAAAETLGQSSWGTLAQTPAASATAGLFSYLRLTIPFFRNSNHRKHGILQVVDVTAETTGNYLLRTYALHLRSAAALTRLRFYYAGGNVAQYSVGTVSVLS